MEATTEDIEVNEGYKNPKSYFKNYSENDLQLALEEVRNNCLTCYAAAKKFNIPKETLRKRVKGLSSGKHGAEKVLSEEQERELEEWILLHAANGSPKTRKEISKAAGEIAALHPDSLKHFKEGRPGKTWLKLFLKRHPSISQRTPVAFSSVTPEGLKRFFDRVYNQLKKENKLLLLDRPDLWWNCNESGFELNPMPKKVFAIRGGKTVHDVEHGKPKEMITATYAVSADGKFVEPLVTFKKSLSILAEIANAMGCKYIFSLF